MVFRCAVPNCSSSDKIGQVKKFYRFPKEIRRCQQWIKAIDRPELTDINTEVLNKQYFLCDLHFHNSDRLSHQLNRNAIPTLNLPPLKNDNPEKSIQTDIAIDVKEEQKWLSKSKKRKIPKDYQDAITKAQTSTSASMDMISSLENSTVFVQLLKLICFKRQLKIRSWKLGMERLDLLAMKLYMTVPHAFRVIQELLDLPDEKKFCKDYIHMDTKLTGNALACLEMKIKNMKRSEKYCVVYAEKIDVQCNLHYQINEDKIIGFHDINGVQMPEPATHAIVIAARGIFSEWEQPLTYCLLSQGEHNKQLNEWLNDTLSQLMKMGLKVTALVSGYEKIFTDAAKLWGVTKSKPYFFVNKKKVYCLFNFGKLMTSLRDELIESDFLFRDVEGYELLATWEDIKTVYAIDSQRQYPLAPELTETHIGPSQEDKLKSELVTQVFSKPVAAAMSFSRGLGQLGEKSAGTIKLIEILNEAIEILNSSIDLSVPAEESNQIQVIEQLIFFINNVTVLDRDTNNDITKTIKCLKGLQVTLKNFLALSQDLKLKGFNMLHAGKILKCALQKCVRSIKGKQFKKRTPVKLRRVFKKYFVNGILKYSKNFNSSDAMDKILSMNLDSGAESFQGKVVRSLLIGTVDYRFEVPEEHSLVYVCGYFLKKCYDIHKCDHLKQYLHNNEHQNAENYPDFGHLTSIILPPDDFINIIEKLDKVFISFFQKKEIRSIGNEIKEEMTQMTLDHCCPCFPSEYLIKLFIRFRILNVIRSNQKNFLDKSFKWKCFCLYNI